MKSINKPNNNLIQELVSMVEHARHRVAVAVNSEITMLYWNIGKKINADILKNSRADYGKQIIQEISEELSEKFGQGFGKRNVHNFVKFNELYPDPKIVQTLSSQLSWSHITILISIPDEIKRGYYSHVCAYELWSVRTLRNRIDSMLYERTAISKKPETTIVKDLEHLKNKAEVKVNSLKLSRPDGLGSFQTPKLHISNIFREGELEPRSTVKEYLTTRIQGNMRAARNLKTIL